MATHRLFLARPVSGWHPVGTAMYTEYRFNGTTLFLRWKGKKVAEIPATSGDGYCVLCYGGTPEVKPLSLPSDDRHLIMWLAGFNREIRAVAEKEYWRKMQLGREQAAWWGYDEWTNQGPGFAFSYSNRPDCGGINMLAAYVTREAISSKPGLMETLSYAFGFEGCINPKWWTSEVLKQRFGLTEEELKDLSF